METYYRRSRTGCVNCRAIRTKCDEAKPGCRRCADRGVACKGYAKPLRWVGEAQPKGGSTSTKKQRPTPVYRKQQAGNQTEYQVSYRRQTLRLVSTVHPLDALDRALFDHWMKMTLELVCLDPAASQDLGQMYYHLSTKEGSVTLRAMLTNSAAHLLSLGRIPDSTFALVQQKAFKALRCSLNNFTAESNMSINDRTSPNGHHMPLPSLDDDTIVGSLLLIGDEIIRPDDNYGVARVQYLLQGTHTLITERHKYFECQCPRIHPSRTDPIYKLDSPLFKSAADLLAWADIMSSVPCLRPPILDKRYWLEDAIQASQSRPHHDLGYCAQLLSLLGDCATAVHKLFTHNISEEDFIQLQKDLDLQLDAAMIHLPTPIAICADTPLDTDTQSSSPTDSNRSDSAEAHNICITAAICHGLATRIFLLRATDHNKDSSRVKALCDRLLESLSQIPTDHSVVTIMLWPLWVLGCESPIDDGADSLREFVTVFLRAIYTRQGMKNVEKCLVTLEEDIWSLEPSSPGQTREDRPRQSMWVWHCWNKGIKLLLA
ncbi:uncharacterized protein PV06_00123 [Exophiala oligosperma]|uniref:Zn(2)-C6 fungal-type domain-containing protein n=1 Tax=Exophiala oligosperma TaxID=215243 RepID=A0A0D2B5A8_9EURO|nr:uncharacterized protein PV06_00123 [Exophiala oligosperma]KIW47426.1 hypothetical protein PV06_00123 [Exophiala oligosperma]